MNTISLVLHGLVSRHFPNQGFGLVDPVDDGNQLKFYEADCRTPFDVLVEGTPVRYQESISPEHAQPIAVLVTMADRVFA